MKQTDVIDHEAAPSLCLGRHMVATSTCLYHRIRDIFMRLPRRMSILRSACIAIHQILAHIRMDPLSDDEAFSCTVYFDNAGLSKLNRRSRSHTPRLNFLLRWQF